MTKLSRLKRHVTLSNLKIALTIALGLASAFGFIAPTTATKLRNEVLQPLGVITSLNVGDL